MPTIHKINYNGKDYDIVQDDDGLFVMPEDLKVHTLRSSPLKPAWEPIIMAMKPIEGTFSENALKYGVAGLWLDGCRIGSGGQWEWQKPRGHGWDGFDDNGEGTPYGESSKGRFPANFILSHSPDCVLKGMKKVKGQVNKPCNYTSDKFSGKYNNGKSGHYRREVELCGGHAGPDGMETVEDWDCVEGCPVRMLDEQSGVLKSGSNCTRTQTGSFMEHGGLGKAGDVQITYGDEGGASRFFYCAKASRSERGDGNEHPTVKPIKVMEYLTKLSKTPTGGVVLDPFMGSGTTGLACLSTGRGFVGIEKEPKYFQIAVNRMKKAIQALKDYKDMNQDIFENL